MLKAGDTGHKAPPRCVMAEHSRQKDGVASAAYVPASRSFGSTSPVMTACDLNPAMPPHPGGFNKHHESHEFRPSFFASLTGRKKEAERRQALGSEPPHLRVRHALDGARSPIGVPPRLSPEGRRSQRLSSRPRFLGRGSGGCYPPLPCPSPVTAPHAPAVVPARKMPGGRPGADCIGPRAGTALAPPSRIPSRKASVSERVGCFYRNSDQVSMEK
jgi:hypothetical protein